MRAALSSPFDLCCVSTDRTEWVNEWGWKDTSVYRLIWSRWPGSSARGRKPKQWAGRGNHDAPSVEEEEEEEVHFILFHFHLRGSFIRTGGHCPLHTRGWISDESWVPGSSCFSPTGNAAVSFCKNAISGFYENGLLSLLKKWFWNEHFNNWSKVPPLQKWGFHLSAVVTGQYFESVCMILLSKAWKFDVDGQKNTCFFCRNTFLLAFTHLSIEGNFLKAQFFQ